MAQPQPPATSGGGFNANNLSTGQKILSIGALVLLISLFLPWKSLFDAGGLGDFGEAFGVSANISGLGIALNYLTLLGCLAVLVWEGMLAFGVRVNMGSMSPGLISAIAGGVAALFALIAFLTSLSGVQWGAFVGLVAALAVGYGAFMRFQESKVGGVR